MWWITERFIYYNALHVINNKQGDKMKVSDCCSEKYDDDEAICRECKEHCGYIINGDD